MGHDGQALDAVARPGVSIAKLAAPLSPADWSHRASFQLLEASPEFSAHQLLWPCQRRTLLIASMALLLGAVLAPREVLGVLLAVLALPFACAVYIRVVALSMLMARKPRHSSPPSRTPDDQLPRYSILVPLYREAHVVPGLLDALKRIDYPPDKLEILFITEANDPATQAEVRSALARARSQSATSSLSLCCVVVPDRSPRTKPRALNYALELATGEYVVVYDAEDCPEPQQLRSAVAAIRTSSRKVGCVQARLGIYNSASSWLTRGLMAQTPQEMNPLCSHF